MKPTVTRNIFAVIALLAVVLAPLASHGDQDPWSFLAGFQPLPTSVTRIADRYVAVIYVKPDEQLVAAVFFNAICVVTNCEIHHRAGFAAVNAAGSNSRVYVEPNDEELLEILAVIAAQYSLGA